MSFLSERTKAGMTQAAVAEKLGIKAAAVSQWETGKTLPRADKLREVAALYGCAVDDLLAPDAASS